MAITNIKATIKANEFATKLREGYEIDREAFEALCTKLRGLKDIWQKQELIDKDLMSELYVIVLITYFSGQSAWEHRPDIAGEIMDMAATIDDLVLQCLSPARDQIAAQAT